MLARKSIVAAGRVGTLLATWSYIGPQLAAHLDSAPLMRSPMMGAPLVAAAVCQSALDIFFISFCRLLAATALDTPSE